jgi:hypothetical protein
MNDLKDLYFKTFIEKASLTKKVKEQSIQVGFVANIFRSSVSEVSFYCHKGDNPKYKKKNGTFDDRCGCKWTLVAHPYNVQVGAVSVRIWIVDTMPGEHNHALNSFGSERGNMPVNEFKDVKIEEKVEEKVDIEEIIDDINESDESDIKIDFRANERESKKDIKEETKKINNCSEIQQEKLFM